MGLFFFNVEISCHFMSNLMKCWLDFFLFLMWVQGKHDGGDWMAELADCPFDKLTLCLSIFVTPNCSFSFHAQLSLGGIIVLQSQGRWGSRGPQHFSFRPGLSSAHCQHQDERTLMHHRGELPGKGWPLPKSMRFRQNRVACFLKSNGLSLGHFHDAGCMWLHERSGLLNRHCTRVSVHFRQETGVFQLCSFLTVTFTGESVFFPRTKWKAILSKYLVCSG